MRVIMTYNQTTHVPNYIFDTLLPELTEAELKVLLTVIRQTIGWFDKRTGQRKIKDRISAWQFKQKTGLSQRILTKTTKSLLAKKLVTVTDGTGKELHLPGERQGKSNLYYAFTQPQHFATTTSAQSMHEHQHKGANNKTNYTKLNETKLRRHYGTHISKLLPDIQTLFNQQKM